MTDSRRLSPEDEVILQNPLSEKRKTAFLKEFIEDRRQTATTEMLFDRVYAFNLVSARPEGLDSGLVSTGFSVLLQKGPFVEGAKWVLYRAWDFAVAQERHLLGRLEQALREATEGRLGPPVERWEYEITHAFAGMRDEMESRGYEETLFVLAGPLGTLLYRELQQTLAPRWALEVKQALRTSHRILSMYGGIPILDIAESASPAVYAVDLARFARLTRYGDEPEFAIEEFDHARAEELLAKNPELIVNPPPEPENEEERIRQLRLRVGLSLWETYELTVLDRDAVVGRPLVGPVLD